MLYNNAVWINVLPIFTFPDVSVLRCIWFCVFAVQGPQKEVKVVKE